MARSWRSSSATFLGISFSPILLPEHGLAWSVHMHRTLSLIYGFGLIPSFASGDSVALLKWCRTAWEGGCRIIELDGTQITRDCIGKLRRELPNMAFGVRGITLPQQVTAFGNVSYLSLANRDTALVALCKSTGSLVFLECSSHAALDAAGRLAPDAVMFPFKPWETVPGYPQSLCGKYPHLRFVFRGKLSDTEVSTCLTSPNVLACAVTLENGVAAEEVRRLLHRIGGMKLLHVGIYAGDDAEPLAGSLAAITQGKQVNMSRSLFIGEGLELMKRKASCKGHIAYGTFSVARQCSRLEVEGFELDYGSARYDADGTLSFVYLKGEWGGFRIHLQKY